MKLRSANQKSWAPRTVLKGRRFTGCGKSRSSIVSEGRGFSRAEQALYSCHSEAAVAAEESAFLGFSQPVNAS
jgi:hypothetical protein